MKNLRSGLSSKKRAQERPLHLVERALRARFRLQIQNVMGPDGSDSIFSQLQEWPGATTVAKRWVGLFFVPPPNRLHTSRAMCLFP